MKKSYTLFLQWITTLFPVIYYLSIWNQLPHEVPTHYDFNLNPDDFHSKEFLLGILIFMGIITVGSSIIMLHSKSLKNSDNLYNHPQQLKKLSWVITIIISMIMLLIVMMTKSYCNNQPIFSFERLVLITVSALFTVLGYFMKNINQNYFFGIRTPWTMASKENWKETHVFSSKFWINGSLLMCIALTIAPNNLINEVFLTGVIILVAIPIYYSYHLSKKGY
ncbi:MAG: SdpI family protein [Bacteroidota bacterium]